MVKCMHAGACLYATRLRGSQISMHGDWSHRRVCLHVDTATVLHTSAHRYERRQVPLLVIGHCRHGSVDGKYLVLHSKRETLMKFLQISSVEEQTISRGCTFRIDVGQRALHGYHQSRGSLPPPVRTVLTNWLRLQINLVRQYTIS